MRMVLTAYVMLASRMSPSGMSVTMAAVAVDTASSRSGLLRHSASARTAPRGIMMATIASSRRFMPRCSGDRGCRKERAMSDTCPA
jgi:hypothetical protein